MHYIQGEENGIADTFLRLNRQDDVVETSLGKNTVANVANDLNKENKAHYYSLIDSSEKAECFLKLPNKECY